MRAFRDIDGDLIVPFKKENNLVLCIYVTDYGDELSIDMPIENHPAALLLKYDESEISYQELESMALDYIKKRADEITEMLNALSELLENEQKDIL